MTATFIQLRLPQAIFKHFAGAENGQAQSPPDEEKNAIDWIKRIFK